MLMVRNLIDTFSLSVIFHPFTDECDEVHSVPYTDDIQLGSTPVTRVDRDGLQPGQLLKEAAVLLEVHNAVQFDVVAVTDKVTPSMVLSSRLI